MEKEFRIRWKDLAIKAQHEYLEFFGIDKPMEDKNGDLILKQ
jgi:hypothetical protein